MFLDRIGARLIQVEMQTAALEAADTPFAVASTERALGFAEGRLGRWAAADRHLGRALEIFTEIGNGQAAAWDSMGYAQHHLGAYDEALDSYGEAMRLYRSVYDRSLEAETLVHIGDTHQAAAAPTRRPWPGGRPWASSTNSATPTPGRSSTACAWSKPVRPGGATSRRASCSRG
jgi:tetratricopeptide (TPR) repeat protein